MLFGFFSILLILISFTSCEVDYEVIRNSNQENNEISFEEFKKETGLKNFNKKIHIKKADANTSPARLANGNYELSDFNISTEIIKKLEKNGEKSYTFRIVPMIEDATQNSRSIFNLALFKKGNEWETSIIEFIPTVENFNTINEGLTEKVEGDAKIWYQGDLNNYASVPPSAMKQVTVEIIIFICEGCPPNGPCDYYSPAGCSSNDKFHQCGPRSFYGSIGGGGFGPSGPAGPGAGPGSGSGGGGGSPSYGGTNPTTPFEPTPPLPIDWLVYIGSTEVPGNTIPSPVNPLIANVKGLDDDFENEIPKKTPCEVLKEQTKNNPIFNAKLENLKQLVLATNANPDTRETAVAVKKRPLNAISDTITYSNYTNSVALNGTITLKAETSKWDIASMHNHPINTVPIFSNVDIVDLFISYNFIRPERKDEYTSYLVCFNGATYALKLENLGSMTQLFQGLNLDTVEGRKLAEDKVQEIFKKKGFEKGITYTQAMAENLFLDVMSDPKIGGDAGLGLYRRDGTTWGKLKKNGNNVQKEDCN